MTLQGLLFFPVTPFTPDGGLDLPALGAHVSERVDDGADAVFAACGTGEGHALGNDEVVEVTRIAVEAARSRVPVYVGIGGQAAADRGLYRRLEGVGVDGLLLMPPYLVGGTQAGLVSYVRGAAANTGLPIIVYQRAKMAFSARSALELLEVPQVVGLKDGIGDLARLQAIVSAVRGAGRHDFQFFNGLPTAEVTMRAYRAIGVDLYSSAVFAFAPDIALAFRERLQAGDEAGVQRLLDIFYHPFVELRDRVEGYQVALVKHAVRIVGRPAGSVRPPLTDPRSRDAEALDRLLEAARREIHPAVETTRA